MDEIKNGRYVEDSYVAHYRNGQLHREDGPAVELSDGSMIWYLYGKLHRTDGPAQQSPLGRKASAWYVNGVQLTEYEFHKFYEKNRAIESWNLNNKKNKI